jgi:hypothetical protein
VKGNHIGIDVKGTSKLPNMGVGVLIRDASDNTIGGTEVGAGNVISANEWVGVEIFAEDYEAARNLVQGNLIGTDASGQNPFGNEYGVVLATEVGGMAAVSDNTVGGTDADDGAEDGVVKARNIISGNIHQGVEVVGPRTTENRIAGNFIGSDVTGVGHMGNGGVGVLISNVEDSDAGYGNIVGGTVAGAGNVISDNGSDGVQMAFGAHGNCVVGNFIGIVPDQALHDGALDKAVGSRALGNHRHGVAIYGSPDNNIGRGPDSELGRNVISGNKEEGVFIGVGASGGGAYGNWVQNNLIGTDASGTTSDPDGIPSSGDEFGNGLNGIFIQESPGNMIGGKSAEVGNTVSGNHSNGIRILGKDASSNEILGNFIGTDKDGLLPIPNAFDGIAITDAPDSQIGSPDGGRNIISANGQHGVAIVGPTATGTRVQGNLIGTTDSGTEPLGNEKHGILILDASDSLIGGPNDDEGNKIAFNGGGRLNAGSGDPVIYNGLQVHRLGHGVVVESGTANRIRRNSIFSNEGRGIDLGNDSSFTLNDAKPITGNIIAGDEVWDTDYGANNLQNYPTVTSVKFGFLAKTIEWNLFSAPDTTYTIDFYANNEPDPSGFGEGERWLGSDTAYTDAYGRATFFRGFDLTDTYISVTATDEDGNTSEFSIVDTDGDGLADAWETGGIDYDEIDEDDPLDFVLLVADPNHKDLFVEVDALAGPIGGPPTFAPDPAAITALKDAFDKAPNALVQNPDGNPGIALHLELDEVYIPHHTWDGDIDNPPDGQVDHGGWRYFNRIKDNGYLSGGFGSPSERLDPVELDAKRLVFRYAIFADRYSVLKKDGTVRYPTGRAEGTWSEVGPGGCYTDSKILTPIGGGNDLMVTLGKMKTAGGTPDEQAGTFMHELGHTLGLGHGGGDHVSTGMEYGQGNINYKPNYHSVMNYTWQYPESGYGPGSPCPSWTLDYSRSEFNALVETDLIENAGLGGDPSKCVPIGPRFDPIYGVVPRRIVSEGGAVDYNRSGGIELPPFTVSVDLNFLEDMNEDGNIDAKDICLQTLYGHEDWSKLRFSFLDTPSFATGVQMGAPFEEITIEVVESLASIGSGPGTLQFSHHVYEADEANDSIDIRVTRAAGTDGIVTVDYTAAGGTATPGSDYTQASGTLTFAEAEYINTFTVPILDDDLHDPFENVQLTLSNPSGGAALGTPSTAELRIVDDEPPTTFVVSNTDDSGPGSLRQAILEANAAPGHDIIAFDIAGPGVHTISLTSPLPTITDPVTIDGYTQPGASPNILQEGNDAVLLIELEGSSIEGTDRNGLVIAAGDSTVRGLIINRFGPSHITLQTNGSNSIEGNFIGTDVTGTGDWSDWNQVNMMNTTGVEVFSSDNVIGGTAPQARNVIAGNTELAIDVEMGNSNMIQGNYIGTDKQGIQVLNNVGHGIGLSQGSSDTIIGGMTPGAGNVIAGFLQPTNPSVLASGIQIDAGASALVQGNLIGTDKSGTGSLANEVGINVHGAATIGGTDPRARNVVSGNNLWGIRVLQSNVLIQGNLVGTDVTGTLDLGNGAYGVLVMGNGNLIGGTESGGGNVVSGNGAGIFVGGDENEVRGNFVGTDVTGRIALGNDVMGLNVRGSSNTIGGTEPGSGNLVSGNGTDGIFLDGGGIYAPAGNLVQGNLIGTEVDGIRPLGNNRYGIVVHLDASNNAIGGTDIGASNTIAFNGLDGISMVYAPANDPGVGNLVLSNSIFANGGLGIDLGIGGVTENDAGDEDTGANNLQNFPVLTSLSTVGGNVTITGMLNSTPDTAFTLQFFANPTVDPSGFGEGQELIGSMSVTTDGSGDTSFSATFPVAVLPDQFITVTATDPDNNTSEFSQAMTLTAGISPPPMAMVIEPVATGVTYSISEDKLPVTGGKEVVPLLPLAVVSAGLVMLGTGLMMRLILRSRPSAKPR